MEAVIDIPPTATAMPWGAHRLLNSLFQYWSLLQDLELRRYSYCFSTFIVLNKQLYRACYQMIKVTFPIMSSPGIVYIIYIIRARVETVYDTE
jgi:hypothetical protein